MQKRHLAVFLSVLVALGLALAGCSGTSATPKSKGTSTTTATAAAKFLPGYLASYSSEALFIEYTNSGGTLSGTVEVAYLSSNGSQVETDNGSMTGTQSGSNLTLTFSAGILGGSANVSGTLQGSDLVLSVPRSNGQLAAVQFKPGSVADYNSAVATLQSSASQTSVAQQKAKAQQQAAQQAAAAAAAAKSNAELQAAQGLCNAVGGTVYGTPPSLSCNNIAYIGPDGSTYDASASIDVTSGQLEGPMNTAGTGATKQECVASYYPELSTGPGYGQKGTWNSTLAVCQPSS